MPVVALLPDHVEIVLPQARSRIANANDGRIVISGRGLLRDRHGAAALVLSDAELRILRGQPADDECRVGRARSSTGYRRVAYTAAADRDQHVLVHHSA